MTVIMSDLSFIFRHTVFAEMPCINFTAAVSPMKDMATMIAMAHIR